jgi:hypothetical protein
MPIQRRKTVVPLGTVAASGGVSLNVDLEAADGVVFLMGGTNNDVIGVFASADGTNWYNTGLTITIAAGAGYLAIAAPTPKWMRLFNGGSNAVTNVAAVLHRHL